MRDDRCRRQKLTLRLCDDDVLGARLSFLALGLPVHPLLRLGSKKGSKVSNEARARKEERDLATSPFLHSEHLVEDKDLGELAAAAKVDVAPVTID